MSVAYSKHHFAPAAPTAISVAGDSRRLRASFGQAVGRAFAALRGRGAVFNELNALSERELADIGISRGDIPRVFDPGFADEHARRG